MTKPAPLNGTRSFPVSGFFKPALTKRLPKQISVLIAAMAIGGCASNLSTSNDHALDGVAAFGIGAAAVTTDSTTPSVRMLGMSADRKLALRRLAQRSIRADNPGVYTVVKGDTLWDISERFLSRPWLWPEIWQVNPQIENPHLIFPGDRVSLTYVDGQPQLQLVRASSPAGEAVDLAIDTYPSEGLESFLIEPKIVSASALKRAPYVVATEDDRLVASIGNHVYARGDLSGGRYSIYRPGKSLIDPDTNKVLGHETTLVSQASLISAGDPAKLVITSNKRETQIGDRLMAAEPGVRMDFQPRNATIGKPGRVISLFDALARAGQNQVVAINLGAKDGVQPGDMLSVYGNDRRVADTVSGKKHDSVVIKGEKSGVLMVFRSFDEASYALIVESKNTVNLFDRVGDI